ACNQIERYSHEGVFTGIFSLVQVFVAMTPDETVYFANPGTGGNFSLYRFHWADFNNEPVDSWKKVVSDLLNIPMAHQLVGFYTVADGKDNTLKVMRSYQYFAASGISHRVRNAKWDERGSRGGHIWHTTGSGKTMTSFKSAQLIAASKDADKVVFLVDRIELGTQSLDEYRNFADDSQSVQATENTDVLKTKLTSGDPADALIVTSIQKMSNIHADAEGLSAADLERMRSKRIVFIVDECHRSTFGEMMQTIRTAFPCAMFFGFTGTPIQLENQKKLNTTTDVFGDEIHRYSIADGIRDGNVLGFDPYKVLTFKDRDVREVVALHQAKAESVEEALADPAKKEVYLRFMDKGQVPMAGYSRPDGQRVRGVEDYLPNSQYRGTDGMGNPEHFNMVVQDILEGWMTLSRGGKFHAILATSSIPEATTYYRMFRKAAPDLNVTALFDPSIDEDGGFKLKEESLLEVLEGYNGLFGKDYTIAQHGQFKKDAACRLAHKRPYTNLKPGEQIDLLIVVDQMLTGFDSKWINTLYLDKVLEYEYLIQAFSRTNRLFGPEKQFGVIRYYRRPHTMEKNVEAAVKLYSGDRPFGLFAQKLEKNIEFLNYSFEQIRNVFESAGVENFERIPETQASCAKFAKLFKELSDYLEAAKVQGFVWDKLEYEFEHEEDDTTAQLAFDENTYLVLALRYKELFQPGGTGTGGSVPFDIHGYLTEIDTGRIDTDYMNENFQKWLRQLDTGGAELDAALADLHGSFATLDQEQQGYAESVIHAAERGELDVREGMTFMDYINEFQRRGKNAQFKAISEAIGVDEGKLRTLMSYHVTESNINEYGRFDALKESVDSERAKQYFSAQTGEDVPIYRVGMMVDELLRKFILSGGFDL
ncbi:MAG: HsdR family type I site-specific deoxyribonuclease, partial [Eggerthellaceae bacterium]|nr:HsdR family type I site-specific deoxyribonuclease [Eggerthellaceae bacterium]